MHEEATTNQVRDFQSQSPFCLSQVPHSVRMRSLWLVGYHIDTDPSSGRIVSQDGYISALLLLILLLSLSFSLSLLRFDRIKSTPALSAVSLGFIATAMLGAVVIILLLRCSGARAVRRLYRYKTRTGDTPLGSGQDNHVLGKAHTINTKSKSMCL